MKQATLRHPVVLEGVGMHTGQMVRLVIKPAPEGTGIRFIRSVGDYAEILVCPDALVQASRATMLRSGAYSVMTPEHLLSACKGLGLTNLIIEISGEEIPILDGSARAFVETFLEAGISFQDQDYPRLVITRPLWVCHSDQQILVLPSSEPKWTYCLSYPQAFIGNQVVEWDGDPQRYSQEVAGARTYGFYAEVQALHERGLALGGSLDNALVIGDEGYINAPRFSDEMGRHKLLDMIGDFAVAGCHIIGHVVGIKSGHQLHMEMVKNLSEYL